MICDGGILAESHRLLEKLPSQKKKDARLQLQLWYLRRHHGITGTRGAPVTPGDLRTGMVVTVAMPPPTHTAAVWYRAIVRRVYDDGSVLVVRRPVADPSGLPAPRKREVLPLGALFHDATPPLPNFPTCPCQACSSATAQPTSATAS